MIILAGSMRVATGTRENALTALVPMVEATRAESGCIAYAVSFDILDDHLLRIFEIFEDEAALSAHRASGHMAEWRAALSLLGITDLQLSTYIAQAPQQNSASNS
jgi:quinol monooxygenase YgiN